MLARVALVGLGGFAVLAAVCCVARAGGKSQQDIEPDTAPGEKAVLVYAGPKIPVTVSYSKSANEEVLDLKVEGVTIESEKYLSTSDLFAVAAVAGEKMNPPLPLLKFPFHLGDHYHWEGTLNFGGDRTATAEVTTSDSKVTIDGRDVPAILSVARVSIDGGGDKPAVRELKFWTVAKHGVLQREIGQGVRRQPG